MGKRNTINDIWQFITVSDDPDACWPWIGALGSRDKDRGIFSYEGKKQYAYRLIYEMFHGPIPEGHMVRHACDNGACCNPRHLVLGTQSDNERDKTFTDRVGLPVAAVRDIKRLLLTTDYSQADIALRVGTKHGIVISREAVRNIKLGVRRPRNDEMTAEEVIEAGPIEIAKRMKTQT